MKNSAQKQKSGAKKIKQKVKSPEKKKIANNSGVSEYQVQKQIKEKQEKINNLKQEIVETKKIFDLWLKNLKQSQKGVKGAEKYRDFCLMKLKDLSKKLQDLKVRNKKYSFAKACENNGIAPTTGKRLADEYEMSILEDERKVKEMIDEVEKSFSDTLKSFQSAKPLITKELTVMKSDAYAETRELSLQIAESTRKNAEEEADLKRITKLVESEEKKSVMGSTVNDLMESLKKTKDHTDKLLDEIEKVKMDAATKSKLKDLGDEVWDDLTDLGAHTSSFLKNVEPEFDLGVSGKLKEMGLDEESEEEDSDFVIEDAQ